jgi:hypothetical protein
MVDYKLAEKQIKKVLECFQEGYTNRAIDNIDEYMKKLFGDGEDLVILGTGSSEWCLNYEQCKEIFLSDWQYWGTLKINIDAAKININQDTAWIFTEGDLLCTFKTDENSDKRYLDFVKGFFEEGNSNSKPANTAKLTEISWVLSHFLSPRDSRERKYNWPVRVSFIMTKIDGSWFIKQIQFSHPSAFEFADLRITENSFAIRDYEEENKLLGDFQAASLKDNKEIINLLQGFSSDYLDKGVEVEEFVDKYYELSNPSFISTDNKFSFGTEEIVKQVKEHRKNLKSITFNLNNSIIHGNERTLWLLTNGMIRRNMKQEEIFDKTAEYVKEQFNRGISDRDKLFNIRKTISAAVKESVKGEEFLYPFRLEAVLVKIKGVWKFSYVQISYPFNYILEGKYD